MIFDGDDLRTRKTVRRSTQGYTSDITNYQYDRQHVILETDGNDSERRSYIRGINYIARLDKNEKISYYLYNGHGDVVQTVDETGTGENRYEYDIFGETTLEIEGYENSIRYSGEFYDKDTGLYYLRARYYNPSTGRFISEDSYWGEDVNPLSLNLYVYCYNDPIQFIDPTGHWGGTPDEPRDDSKLSPDEQAVIIKLTKDYYDADSDEKRDEAHDKAEKIRSGELDPSDVLDDLVDKNDLEDTVKKLIKNKK